MIITCLVLFVLLILDQVTKYLTQINISSVGDIVEGIPNFLSFTKVYNKGAAWGALSDSTIILVIISLIGTIVFTYMVLSNNWKNKKLYSICSCLLLAGCYGNLIDRFISVTPLSSGREGVVDMIILEPLNVLWKIMFNSNFPVFNMADTYLTIGVVLLVIYLLFFEGKGKNDNKSN